MSLFTNVPVDLAEKVARKHLSVDTSLAQRMVLSADQVVNLLRFSLDATFLAYRGDFYQQTFGTAMGSPVSVTLANLVMEDVEGEHLHVGYVLCKQLGVRGRNLTSKFSSFLLRILVDQNGLYMNVKPISCTLF